MPFGLTNVPTTFCMLINKVLQLFLDCFVMVYVDDIAIYNQTLMEHVDHLKHVFELLWLKQVVIEKPVLALPDHAKSYEHGKLYREVMQEYHDSTYASHPKPHLRDDVKAYVKTYHVCQQDKIELKPLAGLLKPFPIPKQPWKASL
ncbi:uncharacterized protein LOC111298795 [Durio zibethinus]|uniref:Uncharacterized protein LOC111298795 n=1 Tax=Durio zibethinus TaxID=66656 RepID=A0A6P5Z931_DURZI|nr:uncharacterized protein LOC111298795 [Durio zibethinus]